jgi:ABC-type microcin C transport system duplicated ATPase subunit YejF
LSTIQKAHYIYVLNNGSVIEEGTHETLMAKKEGKYQSMVKNQQIERITDDKDNIMDMAKVVEEEEKQICMLIFK